MHLVRPAGGRLVRTVRRGAEAAIGGPRPSIDRPCGGPGAPIRRIGDRTRYGRARATSRRLVRPPRLSLRRDGPMESHELPQRHHEQEALMAIRRLWWSRAAD